MDYKTAILNEDYIKKDIVKIFKNSTLFYNNLFLDSDLAETLDEIFLKIKEGRSLYGKWMQKINDKERLLSVPINPLRKFFDSYLVEFIKQGEIHERCHGGEKGWSPKSSLESHLPISCAFSFDLRGAFENIAYSKVYNLFYDYLKDFSCREMVADFFSMLCTVKYSEGRGLPQGSSISMALFNRILFPLDNKLCNKANEKGFKYSRWVDDITITSDEHRDEGSFIGALEIVVKDFPLSDNKVFFQNSGKIFLLGHKILNNQVLKNTKEERMKEKNKPLDYGNIFSRKYEHWF